MPSAPIALGLGIYSPAEAARLLGMEPRRLRRWVNGYTYRHRYKATESRRSLPPVVTPDLPPLGRDVALSFVELVELLAVKALIEKGLSLQHVRTAAKLASEYFDTAHPFASRRVFTDRKKVFASFGRDADSEGLVELSRGKIHQVIAGPIFEQFLEEIEFNESTTLAERWWPLGRTVPVVLDPRVSFGAPVIAGTRIRTNVAAGVAAATSPQEAARAYQISVGAVAAAVKFERQLAAA